MPFWNHFALLCDKKIVTNMFPYSHLFLLCAIEVYYSISSPFYLSAYIFFRRIRNARVVGGNEFKWLIWKFYPISLCLPFQRLFFGWF